MDNKLVFNSPIDEPNTKRNMKIHVNVSELVHEAVPGSTFPGNRVSDAR
jgi:hypothetical protein